jgi:hypothetical protein
MRRLSRRDFIKTGSALALGGGLLADASRVHGGVIRGKNTSRGEIFTDRTREAGIDFVHFNGVCGQHYYHEMMGPGVALFDYDNDGDLDVLLLQGCMLAPGKTLADAWFPPVGSGPLRGRLFRNDTVVHPDGTRTLKFTEVTEESGLDARGYGMAAAAGDFNNDGWVDLYITYYGFSQLWRNNGNGTFTDVTRESGTNVPGWGSSASWVDFDRDGWLDLFVANYINFRFEDNKKCLGKNSVPDYCGPLSYDPLPNHLFRNRRDGTFEDVTARSQIGREFNGALGIVCADFDEDGWMDLYVANDGRPKQLWMNQHDGTFKNVAMLAGCAVNTDGEPQSSMGVDAADFNNDSHEDLLVANLIGEYADLYVNDGKAMFDDRSFDSGLAKATSPYTIFSIGFLDYDNDGWLDVFFAGGAVIDLEARKLAGDRYPLGLPKGLLHNTRDGRFEDATSGAGQTFPLLEVSRGVAFGDIDNDGDTDILLANNNGPTRLLVNNLGHRKHWLGLRMIGEKVNRDMLGTRVAVFRANGSTLWRRVRTDGAYASSNDPRLLFGLGDSPEFSKVRAYWVSGRVEEWTGLAPDKYATLREGSGKPAT